MIMLESIDYSIFKYINNWAGKSEFLDKIGFFLAETLGYVLIVIAIFWIVKKLINMKKMAITLGDFWYQVRNLIALFISSVLLSRGIITEAIRYFYYRPRPFLAHDVAALINHSDSGSFPSGHMTLFFALSVAIYSYNSKLGWWFFAGSVLMGVARIFCGVHYPLDIIGGAVIGIVSVWLVNKIIWKRN
jgi:undecaprenyl-diphosphatase